MGQKVRPTALRIGITEDWRSHWMADKKHFGEYLVQDQRIRAYIKHNYYYAGIAKIVIQRTRDRLQVTIHCARPGLVIGRRGAEVERLKNALDDLTGRNVEVAVQEVEQPMLTAQLVAEDVAQQLERRASFRRALRRAAEMVMEAGAVGVKILIAGRLGGSPEALRKERPEQKRWPDNSTRASSAAPRRTAAPPAP